MGEGEVRALLEVRRNLPVVDVGLQLVGRQVVMLS